jgi:hypothetical protein
MTLDEEFETGFYGCWYEPDDLAWRWVAWLGNSSMEGYGEDVATVERAAKLGLYCLRKEASK